MAGMENRVSFQVSYVYEDAETTVWHHRLANGGFISVCERRTGYGYMDEETGYRSPCGRWWLASGHQDIRDLLDEFNSEDEMAAWVIRNADNPDGYLRTYPHTTHGALMHYANWTPSYEARA